MSWTKQELVEEAFSVLALAGYVFDLTPDELEMGKRRLDSMIGTWNAKGIRLGYPLPSNPSSSSLDDDSKLPDAAIETVYMNLAIRIASSFGKAVPQDVKAVAKAGYDVLLGRAAFPPQQQLPDTLPIGSGNKYWRRTENPFISPPLDPIDTAAGDSIELK